MPFKSRAQARFFFSAEARGELPKGTARTWAHHTPDIKKLPERVKAAGITSMYAEYLRLCSGFPI